MAEADQQYWVAIAGSPASGKSTTVRRVTHLLNERGVRATALPMDGYHYYRSVKGLAYPFASSHHPHRRRHGQTLVPVFVTPSLAVCACVNDPAPTTSRSLCKMPCFAAMSVIVSVSSSLPCC